MPHSPHLVSPMKNPLLTVVERSKAYEQDATRRAFGSDVPTSLHLVPCRRRSPRQRRSICRWVRFHSGTNLSYFGAALQAQISVWLVSLSAYSCMLPSGQPRNPRPPPDVTTQIISIFVSRSCLLDFPSVAD